MPEHFATSAGTPGVDGHDVVRPHIDLVHHPLWKCKDILCIHQEYTIALYFSGQIGMHVMLQETPGKPEKQVSVLPVSYWSISF